MLHTIFSNATLSDIALWDWLTGVDEAEAERLRAAGCRRCGGVLHSATYPRKPKGLDRSLWGSGPRRFSFCCAQCRVRETPASARFFGRRHYVGAIFLLVSALAVRGGVRLQTVARRLNVPAPTLRRWQCWWREGFVTTPAWRAARGALVMSPGSEPLLVVLRMMGGGLVEKLLGSLVWFMPWTVPRKLADGWLAPAENVCVMA